MYPLTGKFASLAVLLAVVNGQPTSVVRRHVSSAPVARDASLPAAQFSVAITGVAPRSQAKKTLIKALRNAASSGTGFTSVVDGSDFDEEYLTNVTVGNQEFALIIDTGSSDTWVAQTGFSCFDLEGNPVSTDECAFGTAGFNTSSSPAFEVDPDVNFNITYGDGEFLTGSVGFDTVSVGGLSVKHQEIGIVNKAAWEGDGINTGLMGLASPNLTSVYEGTNPDADEFPETQVPYNSIFFSAVQQGLVTNPFFSVALDRGSFEAENNSLFDPGLGFISFGGIAPVPVTSTAVTVPIQGYDASTFLPENGTHVTYFYYTVDVESMSFPGSRGTNGTTNNIILDTGTTLNYVPTDVADAFAAAFDPPAKFDDNEGVYVTLCSAKIPEFSVNIGGTTFTVDPADNILPLGIQDSKGRDLCASGTSDGGPNEEGNVFILGDTFLHNVVTTFNVKTHEVTITQRAPYTSGGSPTRRPLRRRQSSRK